MSDNAEYITLKTATWWPGLTLLPTLFFPPDDTCRVPSFSVRAAGMFSLLAEADLVVGLVSRASTLERTRSVTPSRHICARFVTSIRGISTEKEFPLYVWICLDRCSGFHVCFCCWNWMHIINERVSTTCHESWVVSWFPLFLHKFDNNGG